MSHWKKPKAIDIEPKPKDLIRFLRLIKVAEATGCWIWTGHKDEKGYGQFSWRGKARWASRFAYAVFRRPLIKGLTVEHKCRNPSCVNPWHLELLTVEENTANGNRTRHDNDNEPIPE